MNSFLCSGKAIDLRDQVESLRKSGGCEQAAWAEITNIIQAIFLPVPCLFYTFPPVIDCKPGIRITPLVFMFHVKAVTRIGFIALDFSADPT
jgi:hypothetical protein